MAVVKCDFFILFNRFFCENSYDNAFTFSPLLKFLKYFIKCKKFSTLNPRFCLILVPPQGTLWPKGSGQTLFFFTQIQKVSNHEKQLFENFDNDCLYWLTWTKIEKMGIFKGSILKKVPICALLIDRDPEKAIRSLPVGLKIYFYYYHRIILYWDYRLSLWYMRRIRAKDTFQGVK